MKQEVDRGLILIPLARTAVSTRGEGEGLGVRVAQ